MRLVHDWPTLKVENAKFLTDDFCDKSAWLGIYQRPSFSVHARKSSISGEKVANEISNGRFVFTAGHRVTFYIRREIRNLWHNPGTNGMLRGGSRLSSRFTDTFEKSLISIASVPTDRCDRWNVNLGNKSFVPLLARPLHWTEDMR